MEFPRLVYKGPATHQLVENDEQVDAALADGWFLTVPEAVSGVAAKLAEPVKPADDDAPPSRAELEAKATELGVAFTGKTSDKKLSDAIAAKLAEG